MKNNVENELGDCIRLDFRVSKYSCDGDVYDYFNKYLYDVILSDEDGNENLIGKGCAILYLIDKAMNDGFDIIDAFDENHHEYIYDLVFDGNVIDGTIGIKSEWDDLMEESFNLNILVSDRLEIIPQYRHCGYGKEVRQIKRDFFAGCYGIELLHSFPLQLELLDNNNERALFGYDALEKDEKKAKTALDKVYKKDGYKRYKRSELFYRLP